LPVQTAKSSADAEWRRRFERRLLRWYDASARDLPWRRDRDPYRVWLSEVMLQQTRVAAVIEHYHRFLQRFPSVEKLAMAREASVLAVWSGLGYYRRARMLHAASRKIVHELAGKFPASSVEWRALPGIGRYTAAAIASIAFDEPVAVVDGNVERVLARVLGKNLGDEQMWKTAQMLVSRRRPGDSNQAIMELGAMVCLPRQPKCLQCPVVELCVTRGEHAPVERARRQRKREIHYILDCRDEAVFMVQRPKRASLMAGMWELPEIVSQSVAAESWLRFRHSITVTDYLVRVRQGSAPAEVHGTWVKKSRIPSLPLTGLARKILRKAELIRGPLRGGNPEARKR
jgi:A/G-specific adenine glycosylase